MKLPSWLKQKLPTTSLCEIQKIIEKNKLHTVCTEANCPNKTKCFSKKTATFLALGNKCTRNCGFCDIEFDKTPRPPDTNEPGHIAQAAKDLKLKHIVITMVSRDDLKDQGANHIAKTIQETKKLNPLSSIEVLVSDFSGKQDLLDMVLNEKPDIFNHNIETVEEISQKIRHIADYNRSLKVLNYAKKTNKPSFVKSGLMVGLGETEKQVKKTLKDLFIAGCDIITIGQYLQPSTHKYPIKSFIHPDQFKAYSSYALSIGIKCILSGPFVRSSFNAENLKNKVLLTT